MVCVRACFRILVTGLAALGGLACAPRLGDGAFACDPDDDEPCPAGYACQVRAPVLEHRCYRSLGQSYCGDGVVDPGEECDGEGTVAVTCQDLGYWYGTPRCSDRCRIEGEGCIGLASVALGPLSTCAVDGEGQAWCWGTNSAGVLGDGTTDVAVAPRPVASSVPFASVALGVDHACARTAQDEAWCWGNNFWGQLGQGVATEQIPIPVPVATTLRFRQLALGQTGTCGLDPEGKIWCWGSGRVGQLGNGRLASELEPVAVQSTAVFTQVAAEMNTFCGLDTEGQAWCWGTAHRGRLGDGQPLESHRECQEDLYCSPVPVAVAGGHRFVALAAGNAQHACGLDADGVAWCWGHGASGALGQADGADHDVPVQVPAPSRLAALAVGPGRTSAVDEAGTPWVWGLGASGDGAALDSPVPVAASLDAPASAVATGWGSTCAIEAPGRLRCWGFGGSGQLGTRSRGETPRPLVAEGPLDGLAPGLYHTCGLDPQGLAWCWGMNFSSELGTGAAFGAYRPAPVYHPEGYPTFTQLAAGNSFTVALTEDGDLAFWGYLQVGSTAYLQAYTPGFLLGPPHLRVAAGAYHFCALDEAGLAYCQGPNEWGELGSADPPAVDALVPVQGGHRFTHLALGWALSCGIADDGSAWCWGRGAEGQRGNDDPASSDVPVAVAGGHRYLDLSCGWVHCCGLDEAGGGWCWGQNSKGELGTGSAAFTSATPQAVAAPGALQRIVASYNFTCGLDEEGRAWCWGGSDWGDPVLGNGTVTDRFVPTAVATELRFDDLRSKGWHTCGRALNDTWHCWGGNAGGELGIDDQILAPQTVRGPDLP